MAIQESQNFTPMSPTNGSQLKIKKGYSPLSTVLSNHSFLITSQKVVEPALHQRAVGMDKETAMKSVM